MAPGLPNIALMQDDSPPTPRKILHIDMDAFYASVEQRDDPDLRGRPVAVGGSALRGVVAAASYEARVFGVRSAMPSVTAKRRCPDLVFVRPRFERYREVSRLVHAVFERHAAAIEPLSLDEAYLDVTRDRQGIGSAIRVAQRIRAEILSETGLTASAGVSYNKFLAKVASDQNKPDGMFVVLPGDGPAFVATLPARRFHGVGPKTAARMAALGIHTGSDIRECSLAFLQQHFGKQALYLYRASRGEDDRPVRPHRERKSIGAERTWESDLVGGEALQAALAQIVDIVWPRIERQHARGGTLTLKVKFADFQQITRAHSPALPIATRDALAYCAEGLLSRLLPLDRGVRLLGLALSALDSMPGAPAAEPTGSDPGAGASQARAGEPPAQYDLRF
ncbi:MAG: DNA polymerase IV [Chromatocurvus sp.]